MNLSAPFIERPVMTILLMAALLSVGLLAFQRLPVSNLPNVDYPTINVSVDFPGGSPETMANTVATPLEKEFMTIAGVTEVTSTNTLGNTDLVLQFDVNKSMDSAAQDVEAAISRARGKLPPNLPNEPTYRKVNPSDTPIIYIALTSDTLPLSELYTYASTFIGQRLSMVNGVAQVFNYGSPYAVRVQVNPNQLATLGITLTDVARTLVSGNPYLPTGGLTGDVRASTIIAAGKLNKASMYNPLIVAYRNQAPVRLEDLGKAIDSIQNDKYQAVYVRGNEIKPTVVLAVQRQPGANTVQVAEAIRAYLPELTKQLPAAVNLDVVFDRSQSIRASVEEVELTLIIAFALVVFVIFLYLGKLTDTLIPAMILPLSVIGTFAFMYLLDYSIDNLSLLALILAIGFIIDDAIVVVENIVRLVEQGESPWMAALKGSRQIGFTILSMTLSLIAVFIPLVFMGGLVGKIFREFAVTLIIITLLSGIISLTLTPMLCSLFIRPRKHQGKKTGVERFSEWINDALLTVYKPTLRWMLNHRWLALLIGLGSVLVSGYYLYVLPKDFIPDDDIGFIIAFTQSEEGTSPTRMVEYQQEVIKVFQSDPHVETMVSIAGYPQYRNGIAFIRLIPPEKRPSISQLIQSFYPKLGMIPGINTFLKNVPLIDLSIGPISRGNYQYALQSLDNEDLYEAAEKLTERMKQMPSFQAVSSDVEINSPQLFIEVKRDQASTLGVSVEEVQTALQLAYGGGRVARIETPIDLYDVILEVEPQFQKQAKTLSDIYVRSQTTQQLVPLSVVAKWREGVGAASVNHIAQFPSATISFNLAPGIPLGTAIEQLRQVAEEVLPSNVTGLIKGAAQTFEESIANANFLLLIAILAIYIVLGILYESFIHPLTILSTLPPATFGGLLTLAYFGLPLSLYAYLGIILLIGIVKKNGILMVDFALENQRERNESALESIYQASIVRFRPIMMTTITTIVGAIPIAIGRGIGAEARQPLGLVIIGGMLFSQLITLYITPCIYLYLAPLASKLTFGKDNKAEEASI